MTTGVTQEISQPFRPRARMLHLLGNELIASDRLAVFELVKNAYDADASQVTVRMDLNRPIGPMITVYDDGTGMTLDDILSVWLVPGDDHRKQQRADHIRTPIHNRLPLGEKGLGRFAVHKLGNHITLVTRAKNSEECVVEIDWDQLVEYPYLDEAPVSVKVRQPQLFTENTTGTQIQIRQLRTSRWTRGEVRRLYNQLTSICSPFEEVGGFDTSLEVPRHEDWIADLPDISTILDRALWKFSFKLESGEFDWTYEFRQVPGFNLDGRTRGEAKDVLQLPDSPGGNSVGRRQIIADDSTTQEIGPVRGEFYVYDRDREVIRRMSDTRLLTSYLDETGGVRVYRDGIRVYNYGETGDDWLGLDLRRVNSPTRRISRNIILGAVHLSLEKSTGLVEKTNREGFVENSAYQRLHDVVIGALSILEVERHVDKERIRSLGGRAEDPTVTGIEKSFAELRSALRREGALERLERYIVRLEREYSQMQETLLAAGMSGLNLAVIFHEVDRGVRVLHRVIVEGGDPDGAARQAQELVRLLEGFSSLLRRGNRRPRSARELFENIRRINVLRFRHHHVDFACPLLETGQTGFQSNFEFSLVLAALNNLIDNSLHWLRVRWPDAPSDSSPRTRRLYIGMSNDLDSGPAIVVADNGPGFQDRPEMMVRPFFTRKPEGMGLGLYYASLAMELNGGQLVFPQPGEVDIPAGFDGAVVAMVFKETT